MLRGLEPGPHALEVEGRGLLALGATTHATGTVRVPCFTIAWSAGKIFL